MNLSFKFVDSPIGKLKLVASNWGLVAILWEKDNSRRVRLEEQVEDARHPILLPPDSQYLMLNSPILGARS
jgi:methylated-DNA-[protein]-cysteine S-methyltransferase